MNFLKKTFKNYDSLIKGCFFNKENFCKSVFSHIYYNVITNYGLSIGSFIKDWVHKNICGGAPRYNACL